MYYSDVLVVVPMNQADIYFCIENILGFVTKVLLPRVDFDNETVYNIFELVS